MNFLRDLKKEVVKEVKFNLEIIKRVGKGERDSDVMADLA